MAVSKYGVGIAMWKLTIIHKICEACIGKHLAAKAGATSSINTLSYSDTISCIITQSTLESNLDQARFLRLRTH